MKLTLSIISPSFNSMPYIADNVKSVQNQDYKVLEHIIMDGGSSDGTVDFLKSQGTNVTWVSENDRGQTHAINKAISIATGDIIGWLNSDDEYSERILSKVMKVFEENPNVGVVHGDVEMIDEKGDTIGISRSKQIKSPEDLFLDNPIKQPGLFFRKSLFLKYGELNETLNYVMDREYWLRLLINKVNFVYLPNLNLAKFRLISGTKSYEENELFRLEWIDVIKNNILSLDLSDIQITHIINENLGSFYFQKSQRSISNKKEFIKYVYKAFIKSKRLRMNKGFYKMFLLGLLGRQRNRYLKYKK